MNCKFSATVAAAACALGIGVGVAKADVINFPPNGAQFGVFGPDPNTGSIGQVFTAPQAILNDYSLTTGDANGTFPFVSEVYLWNGTGVVGSALFTSSTQTSVARTTFTFSPHITLTAGNQYVAFVTSDPNGVSLGGSGQAFLAEGTENSGAVFTFGNPDDPNSSWINENNDNIGLAFNADFSAAVPPPPSVNFIEYSAKFLCGETREGASVRPGTYETSINIHNPQLFLGSVTFVKKAVPAPRQGDPQKIKPKFRDGSVLDADYAERVDCKRIRDKLLDPAVSGDPFIEGFVVLVVIPVPWPSEPRELDVVAVYTVDTPPRSISLEIKTIAPRVLSLPGQVGYDMRDQLLRSLKPE